MAILCLPLAEEGCDEGLFSSLAVVYSQPWLTFHKDIDLAIAAEKTWPKILVWLLRIALVISVSKLVFLGCMLISFFFGFLLR